MHVTLPSSMQRFMIGVGLGKKRKVKSSRHGRSPSCGGVEGRPINVATAKENVKSARDGDALARRSTSQSGASENDPSSFGARVTLPNSSSTVLLGKNLARTPQLKRAKTFFGTLTSKLRVQTPAPRHTLVGVFDEPEHARVQIGTHQRTCRAQAVPITLPNDIASRKRRAEALRARGLLPPKLQTLSAIEAEEDRRIDVLQVNDLSFSGPDSAHSDAKDIAQSWRSGNSMGLSLGPTTADAPVNLVPEVSISLIDVSGDGLNTEELPTSDGPSSPLLSDACHSPVPSLQAASPVGSNDKQEARPSRPASLRSPSSEGLTGPAQQSAPSSPRSEENLPVGQPQTVIVEDAERQSSLSTPPLPPPSERSFLQQSHITEESQGLLPTSSSQRPASLSHLSEDVPAPRSPQLPLSPRSALSPQPAPSSPPPIPADLSASPRITVPDAPLLCLYPSVLDTLTASPTSPTVPSLFCSSSSEISHSTVFTDNGETLASPGSYTMPVKGRRANLSPIMTKTSEGGFLCEDVIFETTESFPEDDLDPFAGPSSTAPVSLKVPAANPPRRKTFTFLGMAKKRTSPLDPSLTAGISKSASMTNLRPSTLQAPARPRSTLSKDRSPSLSPLDVTMHTDASIFAQSSLIDDDESRRLCQVAFM